MGQQYPYTLNHNRFTLEIYNISMYIDSFAVFLT